MAGIDARIVIADTSVLVNFLRIDGLHLLGQLSNPVLITEHVAAEITDYYAEQLARLEAGLAAGHVGTAVLATTAELTLFGALMGDGRLGSGECAAIACAINGGHVLAIDDRKAAREAQGIDATLTIMGTVDLVLQMISEGLLDVPRANGIKARWEQEHRFRLPFASFAELVGGR